MTGQRTKCVRVGVVGSCRIVALNYQDMPQSDNIPSYHMVQGEFKVSHPLYGWQPIVFPKSVQVPTSRGVTSAIGDIEGYVPKAGEGIAISLAPEEKARIIAQLQVPMDVAWLANSASVLGIPGKVRNIILEWALKLEKLEIKGDGLSFSPTEKTKAESSSITIGSIQKFVGNIGQSIGQSSIHGTQENTSSLDLDAVRTLSVQMNKYANELPDQALPAIRQLNEELQSPSPSQSKVKAMLGSVRNILAGCGVRRDKPAWSCE
jgi:hypothetical protein